MVALTIVAVLVVVNLLNNRLAPRAYVPTSLLATGLLLVLAGWAGVGWDGVGLGHEQVERGAAWGLAGMAMVAAACLAAALLPAGRDVFQDRRVVDAGWGEASWQVLVRIPLGTVLLEEVAFRGVLFGVVLLDHGAVVATAVSSLLFGLWHIGPSLLLTGLNPAADRMLGGRPTTVVLGAVLATAVAGVVLCELRRRSGSLLAPMAVHWATNGFGYLTALLVVRRRA